MFLCGCFLPSQLTCFWRTQGNIGSQSAIFDISVSNELVVLSAAYSRADVSTSGVPALGSASVYVSSSASNPLALGKTSQLLPSSESFKCVNLPTFSSQPLKRLRVCVKKTAACACRLLLCIG